MRWVLLQLRRRPWLVAALLVAVAPLLAFLLLIRGQQETIGDQQAQIISLGAEAAERRQRVEELEGQRLADCTLYAMRAVQPIPPSATPADRCLIVAAAAATDHGGCLPGPVRPDLDTSPAALDGCVRVALAARPGGAG